MGRSAGKLAADGCCAFKSCDCNTKLAPASWTKCLRDKVTVTLSFISSLGIRTPAWNSGVVQAIHSKDYRPLCNIRQQNWAAWAAADYPEKLKCSNTPTMFVCAKAYSRQRQLSITRMLRAIGAPNGIDIYAAS